MYQDTSTTLDSVNNITRTENNIDTLRRLINVLTKVKQYLVDYISNNFDNTVYIDNYANYIKFTAIFRTITRVLDEMNKQQES